MNDTLSRVIDFIVGYCELEDVTLDANSNIIHDLDLDSLTLVQMLDEAEEVFDISIQDEDIKTIVTVGDFAALVDREKA